MGEVDEDNEISERVELTVFSCKDCYVYSVPPSSTIGHRAELWNVDKWIAEVGCKVVTAGELCFIRLYDKETGALFAECPLEDDKPISAVVEPVVDSSRYFVLRVVDRDTKRHAFIGVGFRERTQASEFNAAIYEYLQQSRRAKEAAEIRQKYEDTAQSGTGMVSLQDYSLPPGETLKLNLPKKATSTGSVRTLSSVLPAMRGAVIPMVSGEGGSLRLAPAARTHGQTSDVDGKGLAVAHEARETEVTRTVEGEGNDSEWGDFVS